jgi:Whi5 like
MFSFSFFDCANSNIFQKAEVLRLRLKLASYKVRTNQIDIPINRLQIKTLASTPPKLPYLPRTAANTSQRRIPLPSTATTVPNVQLQKPSAEKTRTLETRVTSSPPPYLHIPQRQSKASSSLIVEDRSHAGESEGFTTPILPRQRQDLLNPPNLGSPTWNGNDLTSSVVKGRAADGLLSLMRQQN